MHTTESGMSFFLYMFFLYMCSPLCLFLALFLSGLSCAFLKQICVCPLGLALCNCHGCFVGAGARPPPQKLTSSLWPERHLQTGHWWVISKIRPILHCEKHTCAFGYKAHRICKKYAKMLKKTVSTLMLLPLLRIIFSILLTRKYVYYTMYVTNLFRYTLPNFTSRYQLQ